MNVVLLNVKISIEKSSVVADAIGNRRNIWNSYHECFATVGGEGGRESFVTGVTVDDSDISFSVRYCKKTSVINNTEFRVVFDGEIYNIISVDHMNYKKKSIKLKCQKVRR